MNGKTLGSLLDLAPPALCHGSAAEPTTLTYELGDLISVKDPLNRETKHMLDAAGRLRSIINPLGQKTGYQPDALDRITQLTDAIAYVLGSRLVLCISSSSSISVVHDPLVSSPFPRIA